VWFLINRTVAVGFSFFYFINGWLRRERTKQESYVLFTGKDLCQYEDTEIQESDQEMINLR